MRDSSLDNVGTYGVRYDVDLNLIGSGNHRLMLSHPSIAGANSQPSAARCHHRRARS